MPPKSVLPSPREQKRFLDNIRQRQRMEESAATDESQETPVSKKKSTLLGRALVSTKGFQKTKRR